MEETPNIKKINEDVVKRYKNDNILHGDYYKNSSKVAVPATGVFPIKIDNRQLCSPTDYQGDKPYCVGYSCAQLLEALIWKYKGVLKNLDAAQIYAKAKEKDGKMDVGGTYVDLGLNCAMKLVEGEYPFLRDWFMVRVTRDRSTGALKRVIHTNDLAIAGFKVTEDWYDVGDKTDYLIKGNGPVIGGHAVLICGFDDIGVYVQNHWGKEWGAKGFAILPWFVYQKQLMQLCWLENKA